MAQRTPRMTRIAVAVVLAVLCNACSHSWDSCGEVYCLDVRPPQLASGVGSAQGLDVRDGLIWIIGDSDTGVARAFVLEADGNLATADSDIALTVAGTDRVPHPTGLTDQPGLGTYLGNTTGGRGEILLVDWPTAVAAGSLDGAIINALTDGEARNGSRPEWVYADGRWLVATADYGNDGNELRLYDPDFLVSAADSSDPNVLVRRFSAPPFVQSLHYWADEGLLIFVQNRKAGEQWKLTFVDLPASFGAGELVVRDVLEPGAPGELEGLHFLDGERVLMITSSRVNNAYLGTLSRKPAL